MHLDVVIDRDKFVKKSSHDISYLKISDGKLSRISEKTVSTSEQTAYFITRDKKDKQINILTNRRGKSRQTDRQTSNDHRNLHTCSL